MAKVATVITDLFEDIEFTSPRDVLIKYAVFFIYYK